MGRPVRWARRGVTLVAALGALDALLTLVGVRHGSFCELNPLLGMALQAHPGWFLALKGGLTLLWVGVMLRESRRSWLVPATFGVAAGYGLVVLRSLGHLVS